MTPARTIDLVHQGYDRVIAAHELGDVIVDPGPANGVEALLAGLENEPRALLLTHIHLDHAGASGTLVERYPKLRVYVHEVGAPHVVDPSKLLASASRIYDDLEALWGETLPVPKANVTTLRGGERVEGCRVVHTPGHASHHVSFFHEDSGDAFVGDVAGVRIPPSRYTIAPTPPPEIDVDAWQDSLDALDSLGAGALRLTHFGRVEDPPAQIELMREALARNAERVRRLDRERFFAEIAGELEQHAQADADADAEDLHERYRRAAPPEHLWLGLERYWRKRAEREQEEASAQS